MLRVIGLNRPRRLIFTTLPCPRFERILNLSQTIAIRIFAFLENKESLPRTDDYDASLISLRARPSIRFVVTYIHDFRERKYLYTRFRSPTHTVISPENSHLRYYYRIGTVQGFVYDPNFPTYAYIIGRQRVPVKISVGISVQIR